MVTGAIQSCGVLEQRHTHYLMTVLERNEQVMGFRKTWLSFSFLNGKKGAKEDLQSEAHVAMNDLIWDSFSVGGTTESRRNQ